MNTLRAQEWLPSFLPPFITLSYPTDPPAAPDSFPHSSYYGTGLLDGCLIITCIAVMAVLRDALRLGVFEPFARWWLTRALRREKASQIRLANGNGKAANGTSPKANGATNGHCNGVAISRREARRLHRSVLRFAEQGWSVVYYTCQFAFGLVRRIVFVLDCPTTDVP